MDHTFVCTKKTVWVFVAAIAVFATAGEAQPARGLVSSPYTSVVNCPDAATLVIDITPATLPAGWTSGHAQLQLRSVEAAPSQWPAGKQALVCHYKAKDCTGCTGGADTLLLKRIVEPGSCMNSIPGQPKTFFLCKPGAVN
jgi:hypothetical protein